MVMNCPAEKLVKFVLEVLALFVVIGKTKKMKNQNLPKNQKEKLVEEF